jgi:hypothetical protein
MTKLLVLFVFHIFNDRVENFIKNCIFYDENVDFILISNNKKNNICCNLPNNVKTLFRDNIGYDFGGWSDALLTNNLYENYDNFIFVNSSVIGPYIPIYFTGKWTDIFLNGLQNNIKLFGSTINTMEKPLHASHIQSYVFSMNKETLQYLINCEIFSMSKYAKDYTDAVFNKEILMSRKIIENNWNIGCLMTQYKDVDFTFKNKKPYEYNIRFYNDPMNLYFKNVLWNEYQLVFIKGNRINPNV